ncbi:MAG TPA: alpha-glucuronidase family glycosyl hydrolase [Vicinamibacterales bacterium]|nr:alpha-glucuronidase family glycosyl hydrolase [Vicinamibacterales bacterium]
MSRGRVWVVAGAALAVVSGLSAPALAETGADGWLRYAPLSNAARAQYTSFPATIVMLGDSLVLRTARDELVRGVSGMLGSRLTVAASPGAGDAIVIGAAGQVRRAVTGAAIPTDLRVDGFWLGSAVAGGRRLIIVAGQADRGVLYGAFALLRRISLGEPVSGLDERQDPAAPIRWVNEWNNLDGSIERGYAGSSIFFEGNNVRADLKRVSEYGRLLASIGINGCDVNNVNANTRVITAEFVPQLARLAEAFRPWGVRLAVSIDFSSPQKVGGLATFDPLDPEVARFWKTTVDRIYAQVPDLGGFVLKADSEGRLGPSAYKRTHADAANVIARALAPHGGVLFYRGFVYDNRMDWRNLKNDRARAAVDNFRTLDGSFDANVILQIKNGPIDFQVREPASPLFGTLQKTNQVIELQITQEYLGQQRHIVYLPPMWKEVLDFDMKVGRAATPVKDLVSGRTFDRPLGGFVGVSNVGLDRNWLGHHLAMSNLYGFGRLAWNPGLSSERIADEWARMTFGDDPRVQKTVAGILLESWPAYENYSGSLGIGTLTDIIGVHFGPGVESSERNGWGQWHRADGMGVGMDRTVATGTGFIGQYSPAVASLYESLATCPEELLLFMHHVPYTHRLRSGKTVIQHIYDQHYLGAEQAAAFVSRWKTLDGVVDRERYLEVLDRLEFQAGHAIVWRDAVNNWFQRTSAVQDEKGRVGREPGRVEAESLSLTGFTAADVTPWETASGGKAVVCNATSGCAATYEYRDAPGAHDIVVQYYDQSDGTSRYRLLVAGREVDRWIADRNLPHVESNGHTATRRTVRGVALKTGETIRLEATPDGREPAPLDYIEVK